MEKGNASCSPWVHYIHFRSIGLQFFSCLFLNGCTSRVKRREEAVSRDSSHLRKMFVFFSVSFFLRCCCWNSESEIKGFRSRSPRDHPLYFLILTFIISITWERERERKHVNKLPITFLVSGDSPMYTHTDWICIFAFACSLPLSRYICNNITRTHQMSHLTIFLFLSFNIPVLLPCSSLMNPFFCLVWTCSNPIIKKKGGQGERYCVILFYMRVCIRMNKSRHTHTHRAPDSCFFFFFSPKFITQTRCSCFSGSFVTLRTF